MKFEILTIFGVLELLWTRWESLNARKLEYNLSNELQNPIFTRSRPHSNFQSTDFRILADCGMIVLSAIARYWTTCVGEKWTVQKGEVDGPKSCRKWAQVDHLVHTNAFLGPSTFSRLEPSIFVFGPLIFVEHSLYVLSDQALLGLWTTCTSTQKNHQNHEETRIILSWPCM